MSADLIEQLAALLRRHGALVVDLSRDDDPRTRLALSLPDGEVIALIDVAAAMPPSVEDCGHCAHWTAPAAGGALPAGKALPAGGGVGNCAAYEGLTIRGRFTTRRHETCEHWQAGGNKT